MNKKTLIFILFASPFFFTKKLVCAQKPPLTPQTTQPAPSELENALHRSLNETIQELTDSVYFQSLINKPALACDMQAIAHEIQDEFINVFTLIKDFKQFSDAIKEKILRLLKYKKQVDGSATIDMTYIRNICSHRSIVRRINFWAMPS